MSGVSATGHVPLFHLTDTVTCFPVAIFDAPHWVCLQGQALPSSGYILTVLMMLEFLKVVL
jgi:hypothetical protein